MGFYEGRTHPSELLGRVAKGKKVLIKITSTYNGLTCFWLGAAQFQSQRRYADWEVKVCPNRLWHPLRQAPALWTWWSWWSGAWT